MKLTLFQKIRIVILLIVTVLGFIGHYWWTNRTIKIESISILASMQRSGFAKKTIAILPMGVEKEEIQGLKALFSQLYQVKVKILPSQKIPKAVFSAERKQYSGDKINRYLTKIKGGNFRLLAFINKDQWAGNFSYVFGVASLNNGVATISLARLKESFYGRKANPKLFKKRLFKITLHEFGHTFGLGHCQGSGGCLMKFINHRVDLDTHRPGFCWVCNGRIIPNGQ